MLRATLRSLLARRSRLVRTLLAITLGVAFVAGTFVLTDTLDKAFRDATESSSPEIDLVVRSRLAFDPGATQLNQRDPLPDSLLGPLGDIEGVRAAYGGVEGYAQVVDRKGEAIQPIGPPTLGVTWQGTETDDVAAGRPPLGGTEVMLDEATAEKAGYTLGDEVELLFTGPSAKFTIVGLLSSERTLGATIAVFDLPTAQHRLGRPAQVDAIQIDVDPGAEIATVREAVADVLPANAEVLNMQQVADEWAASWTQALSFLNSVLLVFAAIALFVAWFIIRNTFSILVTQRTRELGLLRAIGAARSQLVASVLLEGLVVAVVASIIGVAAGVGAGIGLLGLFRVFGFDLPSTAPVLQSRTVVVAVSAGLLTTLAAAVSPARRASRVAPMVAISNPSLSTRRSFGKRILTAGVMTSAGAALVAYGLLASPSSALAIVGAGAMVLFLGVATGAPALSRPVAMLLGRPMEAVAGEAGHLAKENAIRDPRRTAASAAAVMVGLALVALVSIVAASLKASVLDAVDSDLRSDLAITPTAGNGFAMFSEEVGKAVAALPEVDQAAAISGAMVGIEGAAHTIAGVDPTALVDQIEVDRESARAFAALTDATVIVHRDLASDQGWTVGDRVTVTFAKSGDQEFRLAGVFGGGLIDENQIFVTRRTFSANFAQTLDNAIYLTGRDGVALAALRAAVDEAIAPYPNVEALDQGEIKDAASAQVDRLLAMVSALLALSLIIAFVGIANTLALSVIERTRELGLLRAVGMTRRQVRVMVRAEALIVVVLGACLGLVLGLGLARAVVEAMSTFGMTAFDVPVTSLAIYATVAGLAGIVAASGPARRAAKLDVLDAIAHG